MNTDLPYWLQGLIIRGRDNDDDDTGDEGGGSEGDDDDDDGEEDEDQDKKGGSGSEGDEDNLEKKVEALEKALTEERKLRRKAERESKRKTRQKQAQKQEQEDTELQEQLRVAAERTQKLAKGLLDKEIESAIIAEARKQGFIDPTDALVSDVLSEIDYDQDEDDPADIDIDSESVVDAVKELARRKKHLVGDPRPDTKSGSRFRKKGNQNDDELTDAALAAQYPSLRG